MRRLLATALFIGLIAGASWIAIAHSDSLIVFADLAAANPVVSWPVFFLVFVVASIVALPTWPLIVAAGYIFGLAAGLPLVSLAGVAGSAGAFLVARYLGRDSVRRRMVTMQRFEALDRAVARRGFFVVLLSRLAMVLPFNVLNYAFGVTAVSLRDFVIATWIGMLPVQFVYTLLGSSAKDLGALLARGPDAGPGGLWLLAIGLAALLVVVVVVARTAGQILADQSLSSDR